MKTTLRKIQMFLTQKIDFECPSFMNFNASVPSQHYRYQKNILHFDFLVKMKLVSTVGHINFTK